jgi:hypothetical protein
VRERNDTGWLDYWGNDHVHAGETRRIYTLLTFDDDGCAYTKFSWLTTREDAERYAAHEADFMDILVGPRGETLQRY